MSAPAEATHLISRPGMRAIRATLLFACPNYYVFLINGSERTLQAREGKVCGFTVTPIANHDEEES
jgi:hypothetical protein